MTDVAHDARAFRQYAYGDCRARLQIVEIDFELGFVVCGHRWWLNPGLMGLPSMMWRHDGKPCLGAMVRFCDEETEAPEVNVDVEISHAGRGRPRSPE